MWPILSSLYKCKLRLYGRKHMQFTSNYDSRVLIYERKMQVRLATGSILFDIQMLRVQSGNFATYVARLPR